MTFRRPLAAFLACALALVLASCATGGAEAQPGWPMLAYDASSSFRNPDETAISTSSVASLREAWTLTATVNGTPAVVDGVVYVLSLEGLYALEPASGTEAWRNTNIVGTSSPTYDDGVLFVNDRSSTVHAINADTSEEIWQAKVDPHRFAAGFSSPVVAGDLVIVGSSSGEEFSYESNATFRGSVVAFDRDTGAERWRHYTVEPPYNGVAVWSSVSVDAEAGRVFGTTGNNYTGDASDTSDSMFALDLATGDPVWNRQLHEGDVFAGQDPKGDDADFGTNPILFEVKIDGVTRNLVGAGQKSGMFWALDSDTGEIVWSREVSGGSPGAGGILNNGAYDGTRIIVAGNNGTSDEPGSEPANGESEPGPRAPFGTSVLMALDPATGAALWERQLPAWVWAPITLANGIGFVSAESRFEAFDVATGAQLYELDTEGTISSGAAIADGRVYFGSGLGYFGTTPGKTFRALALP